MCKSQMICEKYVLFGLKWFFSKQNKTEKKMKIMLHIESNSAIKDMNNIECVSAWNNFTNHYPIDPIRFLEYIDSKQFYTT